jgi:hypothetical protein
MIINPPIVGVPAFHFDQTKFSNGFTHLLSLQKTNNSFTVNGRQQQRKNANADLKVMYWKTPVPGTSNILSKYSNK